MVMNIESGEPQKLRSVTDVFIEALNRRLMTVNSMIAALQKERLWVMTKVTELQRKRDSHAD